jgi:hypothetical protein
VLFPLPCHPPQACEEEYLSLACLPYPTLTANSTDDLLPLVYGSGLFPAPLGSKLLITVNTKITHLSDVSQSSILYTLRELGPRGLRLRVC